MKPEKKVKKAVWKGWGIVSRKTHNFPTIYGIHPEISELRDVLITEVLPSEKIVKVEVREV